MLSVPEWDIRALPWHQAHGLIPKTLLHIAIWIVYRSILICSSKHIMAIKRLKNIARVLIVAILMPLQWALGLRVGGVQVLAFRHIRISATPLMRLNIYWVTIVSIALLMRAMVDCRKPT